MTAFGKFGLIALAALSGVSVSAATTAAVRGEAKLARALEGRVAGKPVNCITLRDIQSTEIIEGTAIVYRTIGGRLFVNTPRIGQESLDDDDILITRTWGNRLCNVDIVRLVDRAARVETGFVGLGDFVPYSKATKG